MSIFGGIFKDITLGGVKGVFEGIGSLAKDIRSAITGEMSPEKRAEIEAKVLELESLSRQGQLEINRQEAEHPSVFVSGWRPAIGWVCAMSLACYYIPQYGLAAVFWIKLSWAAQEIQPYPATADGLIELVGGMLGLALWRTIDKAKGTAKN